MKIYFVYLLKSDLGYTYIGQTKDLEERLKRHNSDRSISTKYKGKWVLVLYKAVTTRSEAIKLESKLKRMKNFDKALNYLTSLV
jgi:putative endonuclease